MCRADGFVLEVFGIRGDLDGSCIKPSDPHCESQGLAAVVIILERF